MPRAVIYAMLMCFLPQCDDSATDTQSSAPTPTPTPPYDRNADCPQLAVEIFSHHIQPAIEASCGHGGCHGDDGDTPPGSDLVMVRAKENRDGDADAINHVKMSRHRNSWLLEEGVFLDKISDEIHGGGNQIAAGHITEKDINAWVAAARKCREEKKKKE